MAFRKLTNEQWSMIKPLIPERRKGRGRPRANDRATINAILFVLTTGCRWDDLKKRYYRIWYTTAWRRLKRWEEQDVWKRIMDALVARGYSLGIVDMQSVSIDSSTVPAKKGEA